MQKWEYLIMRCGATEGKMQTVISFVPSSKVNVTQLGSVIASLQKAKSAAGNEGFITLKLGPLSFRVAMLDYLGKQGWELVGQEGDNYTLKRLISNG